jgi:chromosome segregation ATPase
MIPTSRWEQALRCKCIAEFASYHIKTLTVAVTDAVDALEERLHYSLQKQDLANSIVDMKKKLKAETAAHVAARAGLAQEAAMFKHKYRLEEKERNKATAALDVYKERLTAAVLEQNHQAKRAEQRGLQINALQAELDQTKTERGTFQAQLEEYRKKVLAIHSPSRPLLTEKI